MIRLNKFLASTGQFSRRSADKVIADGKVKINGETVTKLGMTVDPETDQVLCYGKIIKPQATKVYLMLNKPAGYMTTKFDPHGRKTVMDLVPHDVVIFPVGRLDYDSEGLLLFTNDGDWGEKLMHPRYQKTKEYFVQTKELMTKEQILSLKDGVYLEEGLAVADQIKQVSSKEFKIIIHQGWKRQIRRMCAEVGLTVVKLIRIKVGKLSLGSLLTAQWKYIKPEDV